MPLDEALDDRSPVIHHSHPRHDSRRRAGAMNKIPGRVFAARQHLPDEVPPNAGQQDSQIRESSLDANRPRRIASRRRQWTEHSPNRVLGGSIQDAGRHGPLPQPPAFITQCRGKAVTQIFGDHFVITVLTARDGPVALVCLAGDIDLAASPALSDVADRLANIAPSEVVVDVGEVIFACSTLPNFLARVQATLPDSTALVVCRPTPNTRRILDLTHMGEIATLRDDLPSSDSWAPRQAA
ncbi:STAS domain-containing protein [Micromonospora chokoriensis]